jgi:hypothetical protein
MDLSKVKIGDEVYSCLKGWGEVSELTKNCLNVAFPGWGCVYKHEYYYNGKNNRIDINPEITDWKPKRQEWKPSGFEYRISNMGNIGIFEDDFAKEITEGRVYNTEAQAIYAYKSIRACQILNAYVAEFAPDWKADWGDDGQAKYCVEYDQDVWYLNYTTIHRYMETVYMPKSTAEQLCKDLNDGVVKL